jgi:hypothetical protein
MRYSLAAIAMVAACGGDSTNGFDGAIDHDGGFADAASEPAPPILGAQLDRAGRPLVKTLLIGAYASSASQAALRAAYDAAPDASAWRTTTLAGSVTIERELAANLAVFDAFDRGQSPANIPDPGCGNGLLYGPPASAASYVAAADLLADDQIYVDTSKATCNVYLELEVQAASGGALAHLTCGGRTPSHDVVDVTYSVLAAGVAGLNQAAQLAPRLRDGVSAHGDVKETFPFLGPPH